MQIRAVGRHIHANLRSIAAISMAVKLTPHARAAVWFARDPRLYLRSSNGDLIDSPIDGVVESLVSGV